MDTGKLQPLNDFLALDCNNISANINYQLPPSELISQTLNQEQGKLSNNGALVVYTGKFTGRSPKDKFIVRNDFTEGKIYWNEFNLPIEDKFFDIIYSRMLESMQEKKLWIRDGSVCADPIYNIRIRVINDTPWANLFCYNMFLRDEVQASAQTPEWTIIQLGSFKALPEVEGVRSENFSIINFSKKTILIGGTAYTGEIKKGVFTVLNFILPYQQNVLSMHCSANVGEYGDTALFFGLSGTGKTTLSTAVDRRLIGDDEHGWSDKSIFNFEGGCYAKCVGLNEKQEPQIFEAVRFGALVENVLFKKDSDTLDYDNVSITENTRVSYPLHFVKNAISQSIGKVPKNIFFLSCDAYGILPPIAKLTLKQAMYYFLSGYTAKVAGTENGVTEPVATFSTCFGAPFLPLDPFSYATLLAQKITDCKAKVWLINTGWSGGSYKTGERISLKYTRAIIKTVFNGDLNAVPLIEDPIFKLAMPTSCPGVPAAILNPVNTWRNRNSYQDQATTLAKQFIKNFKKYNGFQSGEIESSGPVVQF